MKHEINNKGEVKLIFNHDERELLYNALWYFHSFGEYTDEEEDKIMLTSNILNLSDFHKKSQEENHERISQAVQKQYPQKVKILIKHKNNYAGYCPKCNGTAQYKKTFLRAIKKQNFCTWCGQSLDWGQYDN